MPSGGAVSALEPTDEMVAAFERFMTDVTPEVGQTRNALAAVLSVVARDRCMEARGHVYHPLAKPSPGVPASPYDPMTDRPRCAGCEDPAEWHGPNGCEGDFGHCPCPGLVES
jgi:hypothetical protein